MENTMRTFRNSSLKAISIILATAMVVMLMPAMAFAAGADGVREVYTAAEFTSALTQASENTIITLMADIVPNAISHSSTNYGVVVKGNGNITIDLNGHVLNGGTNLYSVLYVCGDNSDTTGTLTIIDTDNTSPHYFKYNKNAKWDYIADASADQISKAVTVDNIDSDTTIVKVLGGVIVGNNTTNGPAVNIGSAGVFNLNGGTICGNNSTYRGGGVNNSGGQFNMNGGVICGNATAQGGGVYGSSNSPININSGTICHNVASEDGGGIYDYSLNLIMNGGIICNNTAQNGGGVYGKQTLKLYGGTITDNYASLQGGGVYADSSVVFGGNIAVHGNDASNLLESNVYITQKNKVSISKDYSLSENALVGLVYNENSTETWGPGVDVTNIFASSPPSYGRLPEGNEHTHFFVTSAGTAHHATIYNISKKGDSYYLEGAYSVTGAVEANGSVTAAKGYYQSGDTVVLTVTSAEGCRLASLSYTPAGDSPVDITNSLSFTMPAANVTINAVFEEIPVGPVPADNTELASYYISFSGTTAVVTDGNNGPANIDVKVEGSGASVASSGNTFTFGNEKYVVSFEVSGKSYVLHANCNVIYKPTVDTSALEDIIGNISTKDYSSKSFDNGKPVTVIGVDTSVPEGDGILCDIDALDALESCYSGAGAAVSSDDQIFIDQKLADLQSALSKFESSLDAQFLKVQGDCVVCATTSAFVTDMSIRYGYVDESAETVMPASSCETDYPISTGILEDLKSGIYTFDVNAKICGVSVNRVYYISIDNTEAQINSKLPEGPSPIQPEPDTDDPIQPEQPVTDVDDVATFVDITLDGGKIKISPKAGVSVERVAISDEDSGYMHFEGKATAEAPLSVDSIVNGTNYLKLLVKTGCETKTFTTSRAISYNSPVVIKYSGSVGVYTRGTTYSYIAYVQGDYATVKDALDAEKTIYYIPDSAKYTLLDGSPFATGPYTFFFGNNTRVQMTF